MHHKMSFAVKDKIKAWSLLRRLTVRKALRYRGYTIGAENFIKDFHMKISKSLMIINGIP